MALRCHQAASDSCRSTEVQEGGLLGGCGGGKPPPGAAPPEQEPPCDVGCERAGSQHALEPSAAAALKTVVTSLDGISPEGRVALLQVIGGLETADAPEAGDSAQHTVVASPVASACTTTTTTTTSNTTSTQQHLPSASGDAGSGCCVDGGVGVAAAGDRDDLPDSVFASVVHQRPMTPPAALAPVCGGGLTSATSLVTYKTKALAAAAGLVRSGPVGSSLRLAGAAYRSSSGSLVDTLLGESVRAESGLLTAALPRGDSLPELSLAPVGAWPEVGDLDCGLTAMGTLPELPSLAMLFSEHAPAAAAAVTAAPGDCSYKAVPKQPPPVVVAATAAADREALAAAATAVQQAEAAAAAAAAAALLAEQPMAPPTWMGARVLGRPRSFTGASAAALFAGLRQPQQQQPLPGQAASPHHPGLWPPLLLDRSEMIMLSDATPNAVVSPGAQRASAFAGTGSMLGGARAPLHHHHHHQQQQQQQQGGAVSDAHMGPPHSRHTLPLQMDRQDTFDVLLRQVDAELAAEAEVRQYAALELSTMEVGEEADVQEAAAAMHGLLQQPTRTAGAHTAVTSAVLAAAAAGPKRRSAFQVSTLQPTGGTGMPPLLHAAGGSFGGWLPAVSGGSVSSGAGTSGAARPSSVSGGPSPFCVPDSSLLQPGGVAAGPPADMAADEAGGATRRKPKRQAGAASSGAVGGVQVARYSRVITCKTYLKRLNITQPMAEHLLPYHNLNAPAVPRTGRDSDDGGADSPKQGAGGRPGSYEMLFKDEITLVDSAGSSFRVQYEGVNCNAQKHLRLTSGWRDYIRAHKVAVGDSVMFERRGEERRVLHVTLVRGNGPGGVADGPEDVAEEGPASKKRRTARGKSAQRTG